MCDHVLHKYVTAFILDKIKSGTVKKSNLAVSRMRDKIWIRSSWLL